MEIGRWSELRKVSTDHELVGSMSRVARLRSGAVLEFAVTLVGWSSFSTPRFEFSIQVAISSPRWSSSSRVCQRWLWALKSPSMRALLPRPSEMLLIFGT